MKGPNPSLIRIWLRDAAEQLAEAGIPSALLDAEIILAHTLRKSRTWLHAHNDEAISPRELEIANARLDLRLERVPVAYIIGHKEFYGRRFAVSPSVLIPRPESETIITLLAELCNGMPKTLIDVGTGSGCLGITAKLEHPELAVTVTDISRHALVVAAKNAALLGAPITCLKNDLLVPNPRLPTAEIIIANLPYVDHAWERSPETNFEPTLALFADCHGLALIEGILSEAPLYLAADSHLLLEADPEQHAAIIARAVSLGYTHITTSGYCIVLRYE